MNLAKFILKRAGLDLSPPPAQQHQRNPVECAMARTGPTRSHNRTAQQIARARRQAASAKRRTDYAGKHDPLFGVRAVRKNGLFAARPRFDGCEVCLGEFARPERAGLAARLYLFWYERGFREIPKGKACGYVDYARFTPDD